MLRAARIRADRDGVCRVYAPHGARVTDGRGHPVDTGMDGEILALFCLAGRVYRVRAFFQPVAAVLRRFYGKSVAPQGIDRFPYIRARTAGLVRHALAVDPASVGEQFEQLLFYLFYRHGVYLVPESMISHNERVVNTYVFVYHFCKKMLIFGTRCAIIN